MKQNYNINEDIIKLIVDSLIDDLSDRRGLQEEWEQIDEDIQKEIKDKWFKIISDTLQG